MSNHPFEPLTLGTLVLPNRLMLAPVKTALGGPTVERRPGTLTTTAGALPAVRGW